MRHSSFEYLVYQSNITTRTIATASKAKRIFLVTGAELTWDRGFVLNVSSQFNTYFTTPILPVRIQTMCAMCTKQKLLSIQ